MQRINLIIAPMDGYSAQQRAEAISEELLKISCPVLDGVSKYMFNWFNDGQKVVLLCDGDYVIQVHQDADLTTLKSLLPEVSTQEKAQLEGYVKSVGSFPFKNIIPSTANKIDDYTYGI